MNSLDHRTSQNLGYISYSLLIFQNVSNQNLTINEEFWQFINVNWKRYYHEIRKKRTPRFFWIRYFVPYLHVSPTMYGYDSAFFKRTLLSILSGCKDMFIFIKYLFSKYIKQKCKTEDDLVSQIILTPLRPPPVLVRIETLRKPACISITLCR